MTKRTGASWPVYVLGALCAGAIAVAILVVGPASASQTSQSRTVTVATGVVQSTVSGSGNLQAISQLNLGFKTSGTVTHIYVTQGQQVAQGQLLATLNPQSAEVTLEQSKASLQSAEANLAKEEETNGETSTGQSSSGSGASNAGAASAASVQEESAPKIAQAAALRTAADPGGPMSPSAPTTTSSTAPAATSPATTPTATTPTKTPPAATPTSSKTEPQKAPTSTAPSKSTSGTRESSNETSSTSTSSKPTISAATREANLASARAAVKSAKLTVQGDEQAVQDTKLYAPQDGTIVSLSGQVGEVVSGGGTTRASSASSSSSGSGSGSAGTAGASSSRSGAGSSSSSGASSSGSSSSSGSAFAVLSDLTAMQLVVPLSESEVGNVKDGQIATVTVEALEGRKLAAHVSEVAILSTSNSGVVSYDVTFLLDQMESGLKPGMSATAEVVVKQAEGVNVPTSAISRGTVTVVQNGKHVSRRVVTGLAGNSSTIIVSGLQAGEKIALPIATSTAGTASGGRTGAGAGLGRAGGLGGALGGGGGLGGGGAAFFRGGGG